MKPPRSPGHAAGGDGRADDGRQFPAESEWLDLPIPDAAPSPGEGSELPSRSFVDRVVQALHEERALDGALEALDRDLPRIVLQAHTPPPPSADFVARTLAAARQERRSHWQQLLARHVAPEPSPQFVEQTLAALREAAAPLAADPSSRREADRRGGSVPAVGVPGSSAPAGRALGRDAASSDPASGIPASSGLGRTAAWRRLRWPLLAAAAGLVLWNALGRGTGTAFEVQIVQHAAPAYAHAWASGPTGVVLAQRADRDDPAALASGTPDGLWLAFAEGRR